MIVSHRHKFIFVKTKKTAGTSIEIALSKICGPKDILSPLSDEDEQFRRNQTGKEAQNHDIPFSKYTAKDWLRMVRYLKRRRYYNHMPALEIRQYVGASIWDSYFTFCFERHPIDKVKSHYLWQKRKGGFQDIASYMASKKIEEIKGDHFYTDDGTTVLVDKVYRMEDMDMAFSDIGNRLSIPSELLKKPSYFRKKYKGKDLLDKEKLQLEFGETIRNIFQFEYSNWYGENFAAK